MDNRDTALELLKREVSRKTYDQIRALWKAHSIAEDRRDIPGLLATLTDDCVYEVVPTGDRWEGLHGAEAFYTQLLTAFPDITFHLRHIVIGPQGVFEEADVTATHAADWLGFAASGDRVAIEVLIYFPWDPAAEKFRGERVHLDTARFRVRIASSSGA